MSSAEASDLRQRQEQELEVLKAIYVGDVEENESREKENPISFKVRLLPQRGSSGGGVKNGQKVPTFLVLNVVIPLDYPNTAPEIQFKESKGLSSQEVEELESDLKRMSKDRLGNEMMYELLSLAENYLYTHQKQSIGSFHDEMVMRRKQLEEKALKTQRDLKERERLAIKKEILRKRKEEQEELRKIKERRSLGQIAIQLTEDSSPSVSPHSSPTKGDGFPYSLGGKPFKRRRSTAGQRKRRSNSEGSESSVSESSELTLLEFTYGKSSNIFYRGEILGKSERGTTVYAGMSRSGALVAITEWKFTGKLDKKGKELKSIAIGAGESLTLDGVVKQIHHFEGEMNLLQKLEHPNIVLYYGMKVYSPVDEPGVVYVCLAQEFIRGTTLEAYLKGTLAFDIAVVRHCAKGILEGLKYLHDNDIVHRFLRDTSTFIDMQGGVRTTDYGIDRKVSELYQTFHALPDLPEKFPPSIGRGGKKGDIYRFGVIVLSLINGQYAQNPPDVPSHFPPELQDFLKKCLTPIEHSRWSAAELLEHIFLKVPIGDQPVLKLPYIPVENEQKEKVENEEESDEIEELPQFVSRNFQGHSRVHSEFDILKWLGKGGFGDVLKVKNKLDGRVYALKRIRLNPKNKQLNKKITREVKLLSQLNHENVVRYFNSWIETVIESDDELSAADSLSTNVPTPTCERELKAMPTVHFLPNPMKIQNSLGIVDNIEAEAPVLVDTSDFGDASEPNSVNLRHRRYSDDSDESSDDDLFMTSFRRITLEDSQEIVFEISSNSIETSALKKNDTNKMATEELDSSSNSKQPENNSSNISLTSFLRESQFLYIQMEFCEKSTLKTAIDNNLFEDIDRAWRLFREIVEGLLHIHQQGMIHRDLKPVNIFLDYNDHIKVGDFGLATSSIIPKLSDESMAANASEIDAENARQSMDFTEEIRTGQIGTALYIAPELIASGQKASYNQKVDIYSLGIILFEMFYHPMKTGMERIQVIRGLRQKSITFPKDFDQSLFPQVTHLTTWLLEHDHTKRPTSHELLQSDYLPPPHLEEAELRDIFSRTLRSSKTKSYKYLIASCFQQNVSKVEEATYDMDVGKQFQLSCANTVSPSGVLAKSLYFVQRVKNVISRIFERHGSTEFHTPLLMPKSNLYMDTETCVNLMCHSGGIVSIPYDLRIPFIRHCGRYGISHLKRYTIDKVFRERKVYGLHPRELIECAFDIVDTSKGSLMSDAEVLSVVFEILHELPWFQNKPCTIRLGHTKLLQGVMLHHAVDEKQYPIISKLLSEAKNERDSKLQIQTHLCSLGLSEHFVTMLLQLMDVEGSFQKISSMLKGIMKRKGEAASCIKEALHELEILISNLETFGIDCPITVAPAMTFCSQIYSGLLFQVSCDLKRRKNKITVDVIAAGGRYDKLLEDFRTSMCLEQDGGGGLKEESPCGVGISISLDKLIAGYDQDEEAGHKQGWSNKGAVDTLVCTLGHYQMTKEKIDMLRELLGHGIHASVLDGFQTLESAEEYCKDIGASCLVILKEGEYYNNIRVRFWERGRFIEKKLSKPEAIDYIAKALHAGNTELSNSCGVGMVRNDIVSVKQGSGISQGSESQSAVHHPIIHTHSNLGLPQYNLAILMQEREKPVHLRRKYENQVMGKVTEILGKLGRQQIVEVLGLETNSTVINSLISPLTVHDREEYNKGVGEIIEKNPRLKKYLKNVGDEIYNLIDEKSATVIILYGLMDNSYRILL